jgi:hypothetical protein
MHICLSSSYHQGAVYLDAVVDKQLSVLTEYVLSVGQDNVAVKIDQVISVMHYIFMSFSDDFLAGSAY